MYKEHFGLTEAPFSIAPDPRYLYMSDRHREALAHLLYGVQTDSGFILLTGEVGTGKTTICRCLIGQLPEEVDTAFIINPKLTADELLASICDDLGVTYPSSASTKVLVDVLNAYLVATIDSGRRTLLIIDEAQNLSVEVLEQLRLLTNLETNQRKLLQIILLGQPELLAMLSEKSLRQLSQRITARFHLQALDRAEVSAYIAHRLSVAGAREDLFRPAAMRRVHRQSGGVPRVINLICDRALLGAYTENRSRVTTRIVDRAAKEVLSGVTTRGGWLLPLALVATVACAALIAWPMFTPVEPVSKPPVTSAEQPASSTVTASVLPVFGASDEYLTLVADATGHADQRNAFDDLFALWGYYLEDPNADPCSQVETVNLACLTNTGGLTEIRHLDRPVIIQINSSGQWITVSRLSENSATLISSDREYEVSLADLSMEFDGTYALLWRTPPGRSAL